MREGKEYRTRKTQVQIIDWNLAKLYYEGRRYLETEGTVRYMAPELVIGSQYYTPAVDVWSIGAIMYKAVTGRSLLQPSSFENVKPLIKLYGHDNFKKFYNEMGPRKRVETNSQIQDSKNTREAKLDTAFKEANFT